MQLKRDKFSPESFIYNTYVTNAKYVKIPTLITLQIPKAKSILILKRHMVFIYYGLGAVLWLWLF